MKSAFGFLFFTLPTTSYKQKKNQFNCNCFFFVFIEDNNIL